MNVSYPKEEKLKSKKIINSLFTEGKSVSKYPLRLVYIPLDTKNLEKLNLPNCEILMGVSVSKKYFKKAVERNYFKRILRETYRHNKTILLEKTKLQPHAFMLFYQTKEQLSYQDIEAKTIELFEKFELNNK